FASARLWSIKKSGSQCASGPTYDHNGTLLTYQNGSAAMWSYVFIEFVLPMRVTQVWLNKLVHSTATACNNMDLLYTTTPAATHDETAESWYFTGPDPSMPLGYTFAHGCNSPRSSGVGGQNPECQMATTDNTTTITRVVRLSQPSPIFRMVVVQGCQSSVCDANQGQAERFYLHHPGQNG